LRVAEANTAPVLENRPCVLYWMIAARRGTWNFGLQRAAEWASRLGKPLVVLEALRSGYPWASDRFHAFVLQGMADNRRHFSSTGARYYAYAEPAPGAAADCSRHWRARPPSSSPTTSAFFLRRMVAAVSTRVPVRLETVDSNGLVPLRASPGPFPTAYAFRRFLQKTLPAHLQAFPKPDPLQGLALPGSPRLPDHITARWPRPATLAAAAGEALAALPIDHRGSSPREEAPRPHPPRSIGFAERLARTLTIGPPDHDASSGLSPYLHFGTCRLTRCSRS
jgi:deoxyribodipyrimidine photo-lyase